MSRMPATARTKLRQTYRAQSYARDWLALLFKPVVSAARCASSRSHNFIFLQGMSEITLFNCQTVVAVSRHRRIRK